MTSAIDELLLGQSEHHNVAYFYCSFSNDESLHLRTILGSILAQVCEISDPVYEELESLYDTTPKATLGKPSRLDMNTLVRLLVEQGKNRQNLYILIDGVNECGEPLEILQALKVISTSTRVSILVSSINEKGIEVSMRDMSNLSIETLHPEDIGKDIALLVHSSLESHRKLKQLSPQLKKDITLALTNGAEGM